MKAFLWILLAVLVIGGGGFWYRSASEHPNQQIACPLDAKLCPDGSAVSRTGASCTFAPCLPPNVTLDSVSISYALPDGFAPAEFLDGATVASYESQSASSSAPASIVISAYSVDASSTPLATIQQTAVSSTSGLPLPATAFTSVVLGANHRFTVVNIERFEGVIDTAYYFAPGGGAKVIRFDAIDRGVAGWSDPGLSVSKLPAQSALLQLLATLQGQ